MLSHRVCEPGPAFADVAHPFHRGSRKSTAEALSSLRRARSQASELLVDGVSTAGAVTATDWVYQAEVTFEAGTRSVVAVAYRDTPLEVRSASLTVHAILAPPHYDGAHVDLRTPGLRM